MERVRKYRYIKPQKKRKLFGIQIKFSHNKVFIKKSNSNRNEKTQIFMNKPVYLGLSILKISKIVMYEFWNDYVKLKYNEKAKLCYMDSSSFIVCVRTEDIYKDIVKDGEKKFNTLNYELVRPLQNEKKSHRFNER